MIYHIIKLKNKNSMIISMDTEEAFDKIQHPFMTKSLRKLSIEGNHLNLIKVLYDRLTAGAILNGEEMKAFPLSQE